jgi:hypothetical protein
MRKLGASLAQREDTIMKLVSAAIGATLASLGPLLLAAAAMAQTPSDLQPNSKITIDYIEPRDPKFQDVY